MLSDYEGMLLFENGLSAPLSHHEPVFQPTASTTHGHSSCLMNGNFHGIPMQQLASDPWKWKLLLHSKEHLLKQNKELIEKQNQYIADLKKQLNEYNRNGGGDVLRRLQDRERDVEHLQMRLRSEAAPKYEVEKLRRTLGETEYELEKTEKLLEETLGEKAAEKEKFSTQISERKNELERISKDKLTLEEQKGELKTRIERLDSYVAELPTAEDHKRLKKELKHWQAQCSKLRNQMRDQEEKLSSGKKVLEERAINADRFAKENVDLRRMVKCLQDTMKKDEMHSKTMELEHVKFENERLQADLEKMEKLLKEKHKKTKAFYLRSQESQKKLEQRLSQEEDTVVALREEVTTKEINISELKSSMKHLSAQWQDLCEEKLDLEDKLKQLQIINSKEALETNKKIYKKLRRSLNKVKDIMCIYCQRKEGKDLDMSLLLGAGGTGETSRSIEEQPLSDDVSQLLEDIEEFRAFMADQYADELANNLQGDCVTH